MPRSIAEVVEVEKPWANHFRNDDPEILLVIRWNPLEHSVFSLNESPCHVAVLRENLFKEAINSLRVENLGDGYRDWSIPQNY